MTAANIRHDPHVPAAREKAFLDHFRFRPPDFPNSLKSYADEYVIYTSAPDFLLSTKIADSPKRLVTIFNVNRLHAMYRWARLELEKSWLRGLSAQDRRAFETFREYPRDMRASAATKNFITRRMRRTPAEFLAVIGRVHNHYLPKYPYHPVWLTEESDLATCELASDDRRALRMCQRVGLSTDHKNNEWVCKLCFTSAVAGNVYHPTVLDGTTGYFCPAPEAFPPPAGGRVVDCVRGRSVPFVAPAKEFVAMFPPISKAASATAFSQIKGRARDDFRSPRHRHLRLLDSELTDGSPARAWIERVRKDSI